MTQTRPSWSCWISRKWLPPPREANCRSILRRNRLARIGARTSRCQIGFFCTRSVTWELCAVPTGIARPKHPLDLRQPSGHLLGQNRQTDGRHAAAKIASDDRGENDLPGRNDAPDHGALAGMVVGHEGDIRPDESRGHKRPKGRPDHLAVDRAFRIPQPYQRVLHRQVMHVLLAISKLLIHVGLV